ncbi:MAG: hypothetical protein AAF903_06030 [Pseudomonadota bacterium]
MLEQIKRGIWGSFEQHLVELRRQMKAEGACERDIIQEEECQTTRLIENMPALAERLIEGLKA